MSAKRRSSILTICLEFLLRGKVRSAASLDSYIIKEQMEGLVDADPAVQAEDLKKRLHKKNKCANIFAVSTFVFCRQTNRRQLWRRRQNILF